MPKIKIIGTAVASAVFALSLYANSSKTDSPVATLYGEEVHLLSEKELELTPGLTPCVAMVGQMLHQAELQLLEQYNIQPDPEELAKHRGNSNRTITTESLRLLNENTLVRIELAETFIERFGENSASDENINLFYKEYETSPTLEKMERSQVDMTLRHILPTMKHVSQLRKNMVSTIDPFVDQLDQNAKHAAQLATLRKTILSDHSVTDEDVERALKSAAADSVWQELSVDNLKTVLSKDKADFIYNSFLLQKIKSDISIQDAEKFNDCIEEWQEKFFGDKKAVYSDTEVPPESILNKAQQP